MVFNKAELRMYEQFNIKLSDEVLVKLEDAARGNRELLITIDASHYGMVNGHGVIYRHDTVRDNIQSFIYPTPKRMIERHKPDSSDTFGHIVAADYKLTKFYDELDREWQLEGLSTKEYIDLCKDVLIGKQRRTSDYNGLAYVQVMGKLKHQDAIGKVLKKEFLNVSIGADPKRMICSECGQDQVLRICDHYAEKGNGIFMLAEDLEYEELSFVPKGADPYGRVIQIHDQEIKLLDSNVDVLDYNDFYKITENKTIVCVNNICTVCDQEEEMAKRKDEQNIVSVSYKDEFTADKLKELKIGDEDVTDEVIEALELKDELADSDFAIVQKTAEGLKRRFALVDEASVKLALQLIDSAEDLTETELTKAKKAINKAAKKFGISCSCNEKTEEAPVVDVKVEDEAKVEDVKTIESLTDELVVMLKEVKLEDGVDNPLDSVLIKLSDCGSIDAFIDMKVDMRGKELSDKGTVQALTDELAETKEDANMLEEQVRELNYQVRVALVDEIVSHKDLEEGDVEAERTRLSKFTYEALKEVAGEFRKAGTKSSTTVINNKEKKVEKIKDPTLADEQGQELDEKGKLEDEAKDVQLTKYQLEKALEAYFRNSR